MTNAALNAARDQLATAIQGAQAALDALNAEIAKPASVTTADLDAVIETVNKLRADAQA